MSKEENKAKGDQAGEGKAPAKKEENKAKGPKVTRDNLNIIHGGVFVYSHDGDAKECDAKGAFTCIQSKNLGVRIGDVVIAKDKEKAVLVVVR